MSHKKIIKTGRAILTITMLALVLLLCACGRTIIDEDDTPLDATPDDRVYFDPPAMDYTDAIQEGLYSAAAEGKIFEFRVTSGDPATYRISKTLIIPDGSRIVGNGVTLLIDSTVPFTQTGKTSRYAEFTIMAEGMATQKNTTFTMDGVNFVQRDDTGTAGIPRVMFGLENCHDITITNCTFTGYSAIQKSVTLFDAYSKWTNITLDNCTFSLYTDAPGGGVWFRNYKADGFVSDGALITNCKFYKRSGDEALAIYANKPGEMKNIEVRNCEFYQYHSDFNNPAHFVTLGNTGTTTDVLFENNYIEMESVTNSVIKMAANSTDGAIDRIFVRNNTIVVHDVLTTGSAIILGDKLNKVTAVENNTITVNTTTSLLKPGISGTYASVSNNKIYGNGIDTAFYNVRTVTDNYVESCVNAFQGVLVCERNVVDECSKNMIFINDSSEMGSSSSWIDIVVRDNVLNSTARAVLTSSSSAKLYANMLFEGNTITNSRIYLTNTMASNTINDNVFFIGSLDDISTAGTTVEMLGNAFLGLDGNPLVTPGTPPKGSTFNRSVPIGAIVDLGNGLSEDVPLAAAGSDAVGIMSASERVIIGYRKISAGTDKTTWEPVYSEPTEIDTASSSVQSDAETDLQTATPLVEDADAPIAEAVPPITEDQIEDNSNAETDVP